MTRLKLLGAAAVILSSALAGPAMAQQTISHPANCKARYPNANCSNLGPGNPYTGSYQRHVAYRNGNWNNGWQQDSWNDNRRDGRWDRRDSGISPGDVAADAVGGAAATVGAAVGTAGAIAAAPFQGDSYAYYNGDQGGYNNGWNNQTYAQRNGFVCTPGTWFKGEDGRRHPCQ